MVGWHHRLDGHEFEQALGVGDGQGSLCTAVSPWGHRVGRGLVTEQQSITVSSLMVMILTEAHVLSTP